MALSTDEQIQVRNRIATALEKAMVKRSEYFNAGMQDNAYRAGVERALLYYEKYVEGFFGVETLDFKETMKMVDETCKFWEKILGGL